ncbi:MAG: hypothetical protein EP330_21095 [Deltaproteobacteria bacterium]|nr:MAG: hypothetical protein EP330_21095 [Deltaproteobacteria bacterium]
MPEQQQQQAQQRAPERKPSVEAAQEPEFQQEHGNAAAQADQQIDAQAPPDDGKLHQAHADHARLREEAMVAQGKLAEGIRAISAVLQESVKLAKPLVHDDKIKGIERSNDKVDYKYGGDASRLTDIARGSIIFQDELEVRESFPKILDMFGGLGWEQVGDVKDRFMDPASGYRDMLMNVSIDGHICELQLHVKKMDEAKHDAAGHGNYKVIRDIETKQWKSGSNEVAAEDVPVLAKATREMTAHYDGAWDEHEAEMQQDPARWERLQALRAEAADKKKG